jgi:hypothetical protein
MQGKEIKYFEWIDIRKEICKEMNISEIFFRDYQKVVGGEYKDLWREWIIYFDEVIKDSIRRNDLGECLESKLEWVKKDGKEWLYPFVEAVYKVWEDNGIEYVGYFW